MDGKGRAIDKIRIQRFWKNTIHDYIYLNICAEGFELFEEVQNHIGYYNQKTHHATKQKPNLRYQASLEKIAA